jgi:hypothetical protein
MLISGVLPPNTSNSRWMHLSHKEVGYRAKPQRAWLFSVFDDHTASHEMQQLLITRRCYLYFAEVAVTASSIRTIANYRLVHKRV